MQPEAAKWIKQVSPRVEQALEQHLPHSTCAGAEELNSAIRYSVLNGGKRMRPILACAAGQLSGCAERDVLAIGAALEYLHTASLILDDLPAMDDAPQRRGLPSVHTRFGDATALLAAMALLNQTYALLAEINRGAQLVQLACDCIGHRGMIAGQALDLATGVARRKRDLQEHYLKTTALFRLAMLAPAMAAEADEFVQLALSEFGHGAGMAYQLIDDVHDLEVDGMIDGSIDPLVLREQAEQWAARANAAIQRAFPGRGEAYFLESFIQWLLKGAQTGSQLAGAVTC